MDIGGAERALYQLIREQRRHGIKADLLVGSKGGFYSYKAQSCGSRIYELSMTNSLDFSIKNKFSSILKGYELIHFHSCEPLLIMYSSRLGHLNRYYTHRSGVFCYPLKKRLRYSFARYFIHNYFHGLSGNTNQGVIAASKLFGIPIDNILTTYNGIDFTLLQPKRSKSDIYKELKIYNNKHVRIGTSANLRGWKRINLLIEAMNKIKDLPIHLYIFGDGVERRNLEKQVCSLKLNQHITFTGKKEHIGDYLQILDIFVLPSGQEESFGNSVVEAMAHSLPTIIFEDGGGLLEHIDNNETGYIVKDVDELSLCLKKLIDNSELRKRIGMQGKIKVNKKYNLTAMIECYKQLYHLH